MKIVLIGPPGCGKGTQAMLIREKYNVPQLSTGDILRAAVAEGTELGRLADSFMRNGNLVPDQLILDLMSEEILKQGFNGGYILDGFPRTLTQAEALDRLLRKNDSRLDAAISIDVGDDEVVRRLAGRRQCKRCGEGYHLIFKSPSKAGMCDKCGGELYQRADDNEDTVRERLAVYRRQTEPIISYYKEKGILKSVSGIGTIDEVFERISSLIDRYILGK